ncbi:MAG TPA: hypothetical protein VG777_03440, partial [Thermoanaerobaculia bacterium]|nr:hypothetical protein [Thermoanaerobaculia bacterium]
AAPPSEFRMDFAEFPGETAFEEGAPLAEPAAPRPLDAERAADEAVPAEPIAFPLEETSPFERTAGPGAAEERAEPAETFGGTDNVFEFPAVEPATERETEAPALEVPGSWASARPDEEVTQELKAEGFEPIPEFPAEPVFLHREPEPAPEPIVPEPAPEPLARPSSSTPGPVSPPPAPAPPEIAGDTDIERLAQGASISDLASMVSRIAAPASLSDEDVERISRRVVERLSDRIVRDIAWEVVPELAEILVRQRLRELEAETSGDSR